MNISATALCKTPDETANLAQQLKAIPGVTIFQSTLSIRIEFAPTDVMTIREENRAMARIIDLVEAVEVHGIVTTP